MSIIDRYKSGDASRTDLITAKTTYEARGNQSMADKIRDVLNGGSSGGSSGGSGGTSISDLIDKYQTGDASKADLRTARDTLDARGKSIPDRLRDLLNAGSSGGSSGSTYNPDPDPDPTPDPDPQNSGGSSGGSSSDSSGGSSGGTSISDLIDKYQTGDASKADLRTARDTLDARGKSIPDKLRDLLNGGSSGGSDANDSVNDPTPPEQNATPELPSLPSPTPTGANIPLIGIVAAGVIAAVMLGGSN